MGQASVCPTLLPTMDNFLISVERDSDTGFYLAVFADGTTVELDARTYHDAVLEADQLETA